jgi:tetraacyldisaccharide 4'-kinase
LTFPDHHHFTETDIISIESQAMGNLIVTTEKDYVRLKAKIVNKQLYYLPVRSSFLSNGDYFDKSILNFLKNEMTQNS